MTAHPREQPWDALVGRMAQGDSSALAALYDHTAGAVHALVRRIIQDDAVAEEVTGDVFLQAWQQAARYQPERGSVLAWILAIARARAIDRTRVGRAWRHLREPIARAIELPCGRPGPEDVCSVDERRWRVQAAVGELPLEQRQSSSWRTTGA